MCPFLLRLNLSGEVREGVVDTLREVVSAQAPYWRSLADANLPVPADVAWLPDKEVGEVGVTDRAVEALTISMSRADLKASVSKKSTVSVAEAVGGGETAAPSDEKQLVPAAENL